MQHDEFIGQVQARAALDSRGSAERITRATLETLGERIPDSVVEDLAGQLPQEISEHLRRVERARPGDTGERFGVEEFLARVGQRAGETAGVAEQSARVVFSVLGEAGTPGLLAKVRNTLPGELKPLVEAAAPG